MVDDAAPELRGRTVLVVEDDAIVGMGLVTYLENLGAEVCWLGTVEAALSAIQEGPAPDIAVIDLNLDGKMSTPVIDLLIARQVRTILCTGYDEASIEERFRGLPRSEKPFTRAKIRQLLIDRM